jgi:ABC-type proline/glycine betaine transport system substrate-binding protein
VAKECLWVLWAPHAMARMVERRVSPLDAEETLRNPDHAYQSRQGRTVAEKAFEGYAIRVVYIVEDASVAIEKHNRAMEKLQPGFLEGFKEWLNDLPMETREMREALQGRSIATIVTAVKMKRKTRLGNGSP